MRSIIELSRAVESGDPMDDDEQEASMRLTLLMLLRPDWAPSFLPSLLRLRVAPDAALLATIASTHARPGESVSWGTLAAPWSPRADGFLGMAATEVWARGMAEAVSSGLLSGRMPTSMADRPAATVRLGPRVVALVEAGEVPVST